MKLLFLTNKIKWILMSIKPLPCQTFHHHSCSFCLIQLPPRARTVVFFGYGPFLLSIYNRCEFISTSNLREQT